MKIRRNIVASLAFTLVFSSSFMASANSAQLEEYTRVKEVLEQEKIGIEEVIYEDSEKIRVIIEIEGDPAILYATKEGKKFSDLHVAKQTELHNKVLGAQEKVKQQLDSDKVDIELQEDFTTVFNGFSAIVEYGQIEKIEKIKGVKNVTISNEYERPAATPEMKYSKELVEAQRAWDEYGYNGEGMIIGVIDSGVDPRHKDMILTNDESASLSQEEAEVVINGNELPGTFHTAKVPYGYNYMDESQEVLDLGPEASMHGMHVAGTVGANGDEENGGIKGVAPEAQLLALKVFGNDPRMGSTWGDIYIKAIDDAIILGADVLNMSLGSTASFVSAEDPEQKAIERAVENGVLMSISAGNSAHLGNGFYNPYASNPDIGVVGAPGLADDSLQVASIENSFMDLDGAAYSYGDVTGIAPFLSAGSVHPNDVAAKEYAVEYAALGGADDFEGKDLTGKYALIQRGVHDFVSKALNAQAAGAAGVIVYNTEDGYLNMQSDPAIQIPQLFMLKTDGERLAAQIQEGVEVSVAFNGAQVTSSNPLAGKMSDFTSWGVTPNLDFKPEITAPGGNILSTFQNDQYGTMSGTSMAAPHVSGGSAIVLQRVDEDFVLEGKARVDMAKVILMNTSKAVQDKGTAQGILGFETPYSPRRQGAGVMQLHAALSTPVIVTEKSSGEAKVALKEVGNKIQFTLKAENLSDEEVTYDVAANIQTDFSYNGILGLAPDELEAQELADVVVTLNGGEETVTIPAKGSKEITVHIDLSKATVFGGKPEDIFENGYFVEGFVTLSNDTQPALSVPYVGFKGDWNAAPILDEFAYDNHDSFYEQAGMLYQRLDGFYYLGVNPFEGTKMKEKIAISPNGDGEKDEAIPLLSFLRNAKVVEYNILNKDKEVLRKIKSEHDIRKNYFDRGASGAQQYRLNPAVGWDGTVKNKAVEDGQYYFEIAATIDYEGKEAQKLQIPVIVDTVGPEVDASIEGNAVTFSADDALSGIAYVELLVDGASVGATDGTEEVHTFDEELASGAVVTVVSEDYAGNVTTEVIQGINDETPPVITPIIPETGDVKNDKRVVVAGTVEDDSQVIEFKVMGEDVALTWNEERGLYEYDTAVTFEEDGVYNIDLYAKDIIGNETTLTNSRVIIVDTTKPVIEVEAPESVAANVSSVDITAKLSDNFYELSYYVDGSEELYEEISDGSYVMKGVIAEKTTTLPLEMGENHFELKAVDVAGNEEVVNLTITRGAMNTGWVAEAGTWYYYDEAGNRKTGWLQLNNTWYYLNPTSGAMSTGWTQLGGTWYHLKADGAMSTGWAQIGGTWYHLKADGAMSTGWTQLGGTWYHLKASGAMSTGWTQLGGTWYHLKANGAMSTGWIQLDGTWYHLKASGAMSTGWTQLGGTWYHLKANGAMSTGWLKLGNTWYYLNHNGAMLTGTQTIGGVKYYFNASGMLVE